MKIAVIGPGALGCLLGASLGKKNDVWLLDHDPDRAQLVNNQGLILDENGQLLTVRVNVTSSCSVIPEVDLVLLCVKSSSVGDAILSAMPLFDKGQPLLIALQNGIGHLDLLSALLPEKVWALGVTTQGATMAGSGQVIHRGDGPTRIGFPTEAKISKNEHLLTKAAAILSESGIQTEPADDILIHVWNKLLINVGINALTAIHDCPNGKLLESPAVLQSMKEAIAEGDAVAQALGISLDQDPIARAIEVCRATAANISSMLQDVRKKRKTEIAAINEAVVIKGHEMGIPVPVNEDLVRQIREIESEFH